MSGIVGSKLNIRGSGLVGSLGTDGQHLLSAGAGKTNVFETAAAGSLIQLSDTTAGSDVTEIITDSVFSSTYKLYKIFVYNWTASASADTFIQLRVSTTNQDGSNYITRNMYASGGGNAQNVLTQTTGYSPLAGWSGIDHSADYAKVMDITMFNPNSDDKYTVMICNSGIRQNTYNEITNHSSGWYTDKVQATGFRFHLSTGNIIAGAEVMVYGMS